MSQFHPQCHPANVIPLRPARAVPPPPSAEEMRSLRRAVRRAEALLRAARTESHRRLAAVQYAALREELEVLTERGARTEGGAA